jgi:hypothetical protein
MGKWRRFARTPDDRHVSSEDATGCTDDMASVSVDASRTLLSDDTKGTIIDADDKPKSKGLYWDVARSIQENGKEGKEEVPEESGVLTRSNNNGNGNSNSNSNGKVPMHNGSVKVNGAGCLSKEEEYDGKDTDVSKAEEMECGLGPCAPRWMQLFASKQAFLVTFCITWVLQGMYYTYFVSVITTLEKLFQIQSKTTGIIMSATEIGQIGSSLLLTYYGGQGHRPKWIAWGMVLFAVSSFTCSLPHFLFGKQLIHDNDVLFGGVASVVGSPFGANTSEPIQPNICNSSYPAVIHNMTLSSSPVTRDASRVTPVVLAIFFTSLLGVGMGQTAVYTLGIPYIDDNVASRESPLYFGKFIQSKATRSIVTGFYTSRVPSLPSSHPLLMVSYPRFFFLLFPYCLLHFPEVARACQFPATDRTPQYSHTVKPYAASEVCLTCLSVSSQPQTALPSIPTL